MPLINKSEIVGNIYERIMGELFSRDFGDRKPVALVINPMAMSVIAMQARWNELHFDTETQFFKFSNLKLIRSNDVKPDQYFIL